MNKKEIPTILNYIAAIALVALAAFASPTMGANTGGMTVTAPHAFVVPGGNVVVDISTSNTTGENITGYNAIIHFDPAVVSFVSITGCSTSGTLFAAANPFCNENPVGSGDIYVQVSTVFPVSGAGSILKLNFTAIGANGSVSPLTFTDFYYNEGTPTTTTIPGSITVASLAPTASMATVAGRVLDSEGSPVRNAHLSISDGNGFVRSAMSNPFGYFRFSDIPVGHLYVIETMAKGRSFESFAVPVSDDVSGIVIIAGP